MTGAKIRNMIIAVAVLGVLVAILMLLLSRPQEVSGHWLQHGGIKNLEELAFYESESTLIIRQDEENVWSSTDGEALNENALGAILAVCGYMKAEEIVSENSNEAEQYGLNDATLVMDVSTGGQTQTYTFGRYIQDQGMYFTAAGDESIYLLDDDRSNVIKDAINSLLSVRLDQVNYENITGIHIDRQDGDIHINRSESPRAEGDFFWNITTPSGNYADTNQVLKLIDEVAQLSYAQKSSDEVSLEDAGITETSPLLALYDSSGNRLEIQVGDKTENEVYVAINGSEQIYKISEEVYDFVSISPEELADTSFYYYEPPSVLQCDIYFEGRTSSLFGVWLEEDAQQVQRYFLGEETISGGDYYDIATMFSELKTVPEFGEELPLGESVGNFYITRMSPPYEQTITFYEIKGDAENYALDYGSGAKFTVAINELNEMVGNVLSY